MKTDLKNNMAEEWKRNNKDCFDTNTLILTWNIYSSKTTQSALHNSVEDQHQTLFQLGALLQNE